MREYVLANYEANLPHKIMGFFKAHRPLSNFHIEPFTYKGVAWPSSENAYQAMKAPPNKWESFSKMTPREAKDNGQVVSGFIKASWDLSRYYIMRDILRVKFSECPIAREVLLGTGNAHLEECNWWYDGFFGTVKGIGSNNLGKILMEVRKEIK
jgi:ribA/ribD-fused uncharacterized protein